MSGDSTTIESTRLASLVFIHGSSQPMFESTHILPDLLFSVDLIFTDKPNLVVDSDVHPTLHEKCHHSIKYC